MKSMKMGSGDWFKIVTGKNRTKYDKSAESKDSIVRKPNGSRHGILRRFSSVGSNKKNAFSNLPTEDVAAMRIQTAFRIFKAKKTLRSLKGAKRLRALVQNQSMRKQPSTTLNSIHSWNRIQAEISARRLRMVNEGQIKQRKLDSQSKVEAKLHDIEADWCGGSETMEDLVARIQQREEAAVRRERALAYAFSHQWRPNSGQSQGHFIYEPGKFNWGWSWMDRWIAARPWEARTPIQSTNMSNAASKGIRKSNVPVKVNSGVLKHAMLNGDRLAKNPFKTMSGKNTI